MSGRRVRFNDRDRITKNALKMISKGYDPVELLNTTTPFYATRNLFREHTGYVGPMSYDEWMSIEDDHKAAVLYLQFFEQITLAWYKAKSFYTLEEDGVSTVCQYLIKNVPVIAGDKKRFTASYIYKVAYNCLYCICHDIKRDRDRFDLECSDSFEHNGEEMSHFDRIMDTRTTVSRAEDESEMSAFWSILEDADKDTLDVIEKLLNNETIGVRLGKKKERILEELRERIEENLTTTSKLGQYLIQLQA